MSDDESETMTLSQLRQAPTPRRRSQSNFLRNLEDLFTSGDVLVLFIVTALLLTAPLSLQAADWPLNMGVIVPITILSAAAGLILSRSQFGELLALVISVTYGFCFVLLLTALSVDTSIGRGVYDVFVRTTTWIVDAFTGGINQDDMVFTLLVAILFWFLGYNASWHTFRIDRVWRVIIPPGLILTTNAVFYTGDANLEVYLVLFLFLSLMLIAQSNLDARRWEWLTSGIQAPGSLRRQFLAVGSFLALVTILIGWIIPSGNLQNQLDEFQEFLQSDPLTEISEFWNRLFSPVDAQGPTTTDYYGGDSLELGGAIRLGEQTVFLVDAPTGIRYYWRSRVFDTYNNGNWTPAADTRLTDSTAPFNINVEPDAARFPVKQEYTIALNGTRILYTAPQPLSIDLPTRTDLRYTSSDNSDPNRAMNVSVIRPTRVIRRGETYTATSLVSMASAAQLRTAGINYPDWVTQLYLFVSSSITDRTRQLALEIITEAQATTPYDQAKAIERYLRANIIYNESIPTPPSGIDPMEWVLFDYKQGYCNYYATAMIVMLRTLGIPARMAAGFAQGVYDNNEAAFVVSERDAHTWVEVYFPGYGWVEFEPTAAQAPLEREGDSSVTDQPIAPPAASPTPTITPSPEPTVTPDPTATPPDEPTNDDNSNPPIPPTVTPTPTATPTATPVIVPTQPSPIEPEASNPIELVLPAIGLLLLGLLAFVLLLVFLAFVYWWWEWRGMGGLSPITRAYARLERYVGLIGIRLGSQETPEERRRTIVRQLPQAERPVTAITRLYTTEKYSNRSQNPTQEQRTLDIVDQAWPDARSSILGRWARRFTPWRRNS